MSRRQWHLLRRRRRGRRRRNHEPALRCTPELSDTHLTARNSCDGLPASECLNGRSPEPLGSRLPQNAEESGIAIRVSSVDKAMSPIIGITSVLKARGSRRTRPAPHVQAILTPEAYGEAWLKQNYQLSMKELPGTRSQDLEALFRRPASVHAGKFVQKSPRPRRGLLQPEQHVRPPSASTGAQRLGGGGQGIERPVSARVGAAVAVVIFVRVARTLSWCGEAVEAGASDCS